MAPLQMKASQPLKAGAVAHRPRGAVAARTAMQEAPTRVGPRLDKKYNAPHEVPEEGIDRIVAMLRSGDLFRYGGNGEGALQVRTRQSECGLRDPALRAWPRARLRVHRATFGRLAPRVLTDRFSTLRNVAERFVAELAQAGAPCARRAK